MAFWKKILKHYNNHCPTGCDAQPSNPWRQSGDSSNTMLPNSVVSTIWCLHWMSLRHLPKMFLTTSLSCIRWKILNNCLLLFYTVDWYWKTSYAGGICPPKSNNRIPKRTRSLCPCRNGRCWTCLRRQETLKGHQKRMMSKFCRRWALARGQPCHWGIRMRRKNSNLASNANMPWGLKLRQLLRWRLPTCKKHRFLHD